MHLGIAVPSVLVHVAVKFPFGAIAYLSFTRIYTVSPKAAAMVRANAMSVRFGPAGFIGTKAVDMGVNAGVFSCILPCAACVCVASAEYAL